MKRSINLKKIACVILASMSVLLAGCKGCGNKKKNTDTDVQAANATYGTHIDNSTEIGGFIVKEKFSEYDILLPKESMEYEELAASLIQTYVYQATGVNLDIVTDETVSAKGKYISLGDTTIMRASGISVAYEEFDESGYIIKTVADDICISGSRSGIRRGTYYGAVKFLNKTIGFVPYAADEIYYEKSIVIPMQNFDVVEIPSFATRSISWRIVRSNPSYARMLGLTATVNGYEDSLSYSGHSHFEILPPETYLEENPDWYYCAKEGYADVVEAYHSLGKDFNKYAQLCLSNEEMAEEFAKVLAQGFLDNPHAFYAHSGMVDNVEFCDCDNCTANREKYHTNNAGINVLFTNKVAKRVNEIVHKTQPNRDVLIRTFAYYETLEPPADYDKETGTWTAHAEEVVPNEYVRIMYTPLPYYPTESFEHEVNAIYKQHLEGWNYLTEDMFCWIYNINFHCYPIAMANWDALVENYRFLYNNGVKYAVNQGPVHNTTSQMEELRMYVESQIMWDLNRDYETLAKDFIDHYYGPAAKLIAQMFDMTTSYNQYATEELGMLVNMYGNINDKKYWTFNYVESVRKVMEQALAEVEKLQDKQEYEKYYWRVLRAYMENIYMQMEFYIDKYPQSYSLQIIQKFESVVNKYGMTMIFESSGGDTYAKWIDKWKNQCS